MSDNENRSSIAGLLFIMLFIGLAISEVVGLWVAFNNSMGHGFLALVFPPVAIFLGARHLLF